MLPSPSIFPTETLMRMSNHVHPPVSLRRQWRHIPASSVEVICACIAVRIYPCVALRRGFSSRRKRVAAKSAPAQSFVVYDVPSPPAVALSTWRPGSNRMLISQASLQKNTAPRPKMTSRGR